MDVQLGRPRALPPFPPERRRPDSAAAAPDGAPQLRVLPGADLLPSRSYRAPWREEAVRSAPTRAPQP